MFSASDGMLRDFLEAARGLLRRPAAPILALAVLSLGMGVNAAIFSLVDVVLFQHLPVDHPEQLVRFFSASSARGTDTGRVSLPFVADYRAAVETVMSLETWSDRLPVDIVTEGRFAERLTAAAVSPGFFESLGVAPAIGRFVGREDHEAGAVLVLSFRLWRRAFDRDPRVLGTVVHVNRQPFVVVGVTPEGFEGIGLESLPDAWIPLSQLNTAMPAWRDQVHYRSSTFFHAVGRLAPGMDLRSARAHLAIVAEGLGAGQSARRGPEVEDPDWREPWPWIESAEAAAARTARALASLLAGVAGLVLALAGVNVAALMLARADGRRRETAVRVALGGSRSRVVRPLVFEALLLSLTGAVGGLLVAHMSAEILVDLAPTDIALPLAARSSVLAPRVLVASTAMALFSTLIAGVWPAFRAARIDPVAGLRNDVPAGAARWLSTQGALVVLQVGAATVLLVGVGALLRSIGAAARLHPGVRTEGIFVADLDLARSGYDKPRGAAMVSHLEERLGTAAGASAAALSTGSPLGGGPKTTVTIDGAATLVDFAMVTPAYFATLGVPVIQGRGFERADGPRAAPVAVVNRAFAQRFWPGADPVGRYITGFTPRDASLVVVGVASDVRTHGLREPAHPMMYVPLAQFYEAFPWQFGLTAIVRAPGANTPAANALMETTVHAIDPLLPVLRPRSLETALGEPFGQQRMLASLLGAFAVLALWLAGSGLYGILSLATVARTKEFGVRMAVGARPRDLRRSVHGRSLALCGLGIVGGLAGALAGYRVLEPFVFDVPSIDPLTLTAAPIVLLLVSVAAADGPARRVATVDVVDALRHE